jgi:hypothetical protein
VHGPHWPAQRLESGNPFNILKEENVEMKKSLSIGFVSLAMLLTVALGAAGQNFSGTWVLDKSKSEGLGRNMENADVTMVVTQDDKQLTVETQVSGASGQSRPPEKITYNLDGSKTSADIGGRMAMKASLTAAWKDSGKTLELNQERTGNFNGNDFTATLKDLWTLDGSGKVLTISRKSDSPRGAQESKLTFNKK